MVYDAAHMRTAALAIALVAASCASTPDLPVRLDPAPPIGSTTEVVTAPDGTQLYARHWAPTEAPKAVVVIMHGLKDHSARYAAFATRLTGAGYSVYAFDLRGHGRSSGKRVAPGRWWRYVDDLDRFLASIETREPGRPVFVFGHSMGGAIATAAAIQHEPRIAGLILSGPALAIDAQPLLLAATRMAGALTPGFPGLSLDNGDFSSDPAAKKTMDDDPLISQPAGPAKTAAGLVDGMRVIWAHTDRLTMPVLALHGTKDKLTAPAGSRLLVQTIASTDKTLRIYDGLYHDLLHEPNGKQVEDDIVAWLDGHTGGTPVPPPPMYTGDLTGDPRGWTQAVAMGAGVARVAERTRFTADLSFHLARPRPFGWHGMVSARLLSDYKEATLAPAGVAYRFGTANIGGIAGVASGATFLSGPQHVAIPATAWLELSFGPAHLSASAALLYRMGGDPARDGPLSSDVATVSGALRFGGERAYWPGAIAGVGPYVGASLTSVSGDRTWTLTAGLQLYAGD
jgi:alpha-beta hydrolase superfamily lysophospholipase